jgi:hypothetical protein
MCRQTRPFLRTEFHSFPVSVTVFVLRKISAPELFMVRGFSISNMCLELDRINASLGYCINIGMSHAEAALMRLGDFSNDETGMA